MQRSLRLAIPELGTDEYEYISIVVDFGSQPAELEAYATQQGFDWTFTVASEAFLGDFIAQYGRGVVTTPNMVHFVMQPDGSITEMFKGTPSTETLIQEIRSATVG